MAHKYTFEQINFIRNNVAGISNLGLTNRFNNEFGTRLSVDQIRGYKKNHKLSSGLDGRFKKGNVPYNKGTKGISKPNKTSFKKGDIPANHRPVGSERLHADGYVQIKVAEPNKWKLKQRVIWEQYNGEIPKGHVILFADGDKKNFDINNLILITNRQMMVMNNRGLINKDADLNKSGAIVADILIKIKDKVRIL